MTGHARYDALVWAWAVLALVSFLVLLKTAAPYGRHSRPAWGPRVPHKVGWIVMELFSPLVFSYFFLLGDQTKTLVSWTFFALWMLHYLNRSLIYPLRQPARGHPMPVVVMGHQKGRNTRENIERNFGMAHPEGYRKSLRLMHMAARFQKPVITFIDTPGAYPGI